MGFHNGSPVWMSFIETRLTKCNELTSFSPSLRISAFVVWSNSRRMATTVARFMNSFSSEPPRDAFVLYSTMSPTSMFSHMNEYFSTEGSFVAAREIRGSFEFELTLAFFGTAEALESVILSERYILAIAMTNMYISHRILHGVRGEYLNNSCSDIAFLNRFFMSVAVNRVSASCTME